MWKGAESQFWFSQADIKSNTELNLLALSDSFMETEITAEWEIRGKKKMLRKFRALILEADYFNLVFPDWASS